MFKMFFVPLDVGITSSVAEIPSNSFPFKKYRKNTTLDKLSRVDAPYHTTVVALRPEQGPNQNQPW